jgi:DNA repair exonuclease SbcCD nuclease subunit
VNPHETRILFVGDMHLGTRVSRVPASAGNPGRFGPAEAWRRAVDAAVEHQVHAVALAGDVVNGRNELFEARRPLDRGLASLAEAGIPVIAVAGNHDTATLPALARDDDRLILLGAGGTWSAHEVVPPQGTAVRLVGWSFPREHWEESPLATPPPPRDGVTFGLLHADLDAGASPYAPVAATELAACGYDGWFLGHVHTPGPVPTDPRPFYLGSLTGLDPTETGVHGPVLVTVAADGTIGRERLPLAPLRWETVVVPCDELRDPESDLRSVLDAALSEFVANAGLEPGMALGARIELSGAVDRPHAVTEAAGRLDPADLVTEVGRVVVFVDALDSRVHGRVDVADLARGSDPLGLLAHRVLVLEGARDDGELLARLLDRSRLAVDLVDNLPACRRLDGTLDGSARRRLAARAARGLLDRLLAEREAAP